MQCRRVQGGAGLRFWEGGGAVAEAETEADPPPPVLYS